MKNVFCLLAAIHLALCFAGCSQEETSQTMPQNLVVAPSPDASLSSVPEIDLDLTEMSSTMVYSNVYNMLNDPASYLGKRVKISGNFAVYTNPQTDQRYYACLVADAAACCAQGIEFLWRGKHTYPSDYPDEGAMITVTGSFDTYLEDGATYVVLKDADVTFERP